MYLFLCSAGGEKRGMISIGDVEEVMVTHVVDPEHFHCQLSKTAAQLDTLMDSLEKHYSALGEAEEQLTAVSLGRHCVAKYSADQDWYRAEITGRRFKTRKTGIKSLLSKRGWEIKTIGILSLIMPNKTNIIFWIIAPFSHLVAGIWEKNKRWTQICNNLNFWFSFSKHWLFRIQFELNYVFEKYIHM